MREVQFEFVDDAPDEVRYLRLESRVRESMRRPGDGERPEDVDADELPEWWADAVDEFRSHDLRPYKPPRFSDDVLVPPIVARFESASDTDIRFMGVDVRYGDSWGVYVDGDVVATVDRERTADGYTRYEIASDEFERAVRGHRDVADTVHSSDCSRDAVSNE